MRQGDECVTFTRRDHQMVAGDRTHPLPEPPPLTHRMGHQRQLRPPRLVVDLAVVDRDDDAVVWCQVGRP